MRPRTLLALPLVAFVACTGLPERLESASWPVVANCEGELSDAGVVRRGRLIHVATRHGEQRLNPVESARTLAAADGGFCVSLDGDAEVSLCFDSGRCVRAASVEGSISTLRALAFGMVPVGRTSLQTFTVTNRLGDRIVVSASSAAPDFSLSPSSFAIDGLRSRSVVASFTPSVAGAQVGTLSLSEGDTVVPIEVSGFGGGPVLFVQQFVDAGFVTRVPPARTFERRRLEVRNDSEPGPQAQFVPGLVQARTTWCSAGGVLPRLSVVEPNTVEPGQSAFFDLLIEPAVDEVSSHCKAEVKLGPVWYPFEFSYVGIVRAPINIGYTSVWPPDGGLTINLLHDWRDPAWVSWPRLENKDGGLELVTTWTEHFLLPYQSLTVFVRQTRPMVDLPNAVLVDGNVGAGGTARFPIVAR